MNNNVITTGSFSNGIGSDGHRCLLYLMNFGGVQPISIKLDYQVGITYSYFISLRNYPQNFWSAHRPVPVDLFFCREHVPTYEFYGLPFSHALLSRDAAYPSHE
jgi:hypothetical protein